MREICAKRNRHSQVSKHRHFPWHHGKEKPLRAYFAHGRKALHARVQAAVAILGVDGEAACTETKTSHSSSGHEWHTEEEEGKGNTFRGTAEGLPKNQQAEALSPPGALPIRSVYDSQKGQQQNSPSVTREPKEPESLGSRGASCEAEGGREPHWRFHSQAQGPPLFLPSPCRPSGSQPSQGAPPPLSASCSAPFPAHHQLSHLLPNLELQLADPPPSPLDLLLKQRSGILAVALITSLRRKPERGGGVIGLFGNKMGGLPKGSFPWETRASLSAALLLPLAATRSVKSNGQGWGWGPEGPRLCPCSEPNPSFFGRARHRPTGVSTHTCNSASSCCSIFLRICVACFWTSGS